MYKSRRYLLQKSMNFLNQESKKFLRASGELSLYHPLAPYFQVAPPSTSGWICPCVHPNELTKMPVGRACQLLLTEPVSVAKAERNSSKLNIVQNCLRSTMRNERLNDLFTLDNVCVVVKVLFSKVEAVQ